MTNKPLTTTVGDLRKAWIDHLRDAGKTLLTAASYDLDMKLAEDFFGADRAIDALTAEDIDAFNASEAVNVLRSGRDKSPHTIAKTQRALRMALAWRSGQPAKTAKPKKAPATKKPKSGGKKKRAVVYVATPIEEPAAGYDLRESQEEDAAI